MEQQPSIVELIDENNETVSFEHLMTLDYGDREYIVLIPLEGDETEEEDVVILRVEQDEDGDDIYVSIDDEEELDEVFDAFQQVMEEGEE